MNPELNIRSAGFDPNFADHRNGSIAHGLILAIGKRLRRGDGDRIAGMHAHGIEVLDRADDDDVIFQITHHLEFVFFPSQNRLFDQRFVDGREIESAGQHFQHLFAVVSDAAAAAAQGERRPHNDRKPDLAGKFQAVFQIVDQRRLGNIEADLLHRVFEVKTVFGLLDCRHIRADQLHVVLVEYAAVREFDGQIERGLSAHRGQDGESLARRHLTLDANNFFQIFPRERLDVSAVGKLRIGHDGGRIGIGQHHFKSLGLKRLASLRPGVVKLRRLANDDGARANDENFRDVSSSRHRL